MFCPDCGESIPDDSEFCPECGNKIPGPKRSWFQSRHLVWVSAAIVLLGIVAVAVLVNRSGRTPVPLDEPFDGADTPTAVNTELDQLDAECSEGDLQSCDELYLASPPDSDYEFFAATCGELYDDEQKAGSCADSQ